MEQKKNRAVAIWLLAGVGMIMVQVLLGGITRLTGSGLSITEWKPIMGAIPPLNDHDWNIAFDAYKRLGQYQYLNYDFTIEDFKFIYFWEWFHRLWARMLGVVFAIGFVYFLIKGYFNKKMIVPFVILFILGALQGLVGWIMVKSGLNEDDLYVNHIKLAAHFISALVLLCYTLWFALQLLVREEQRTAHRRLKGFTFLLIAVLGVQLVYGAFMAGLKAAPSAPTFPSINGSWAPPTLQSQSWANSPLNVQFFHRMLAYLLVVLITVWFVASRKAIVSNTKQLFARHRYYPMMLVVLQLLLGIGTILLAPKMGTSRFGTYELVAQLHQLVAMFLLVSLIVNFYLLKGERRLS